MDVAEDASSSLVVISALLYPCDRLAASHLPAPCQLEELTPQQSSPASDFTPALSTETEMSGMGSSCHSQPLALTWTGTCTLSLFSTTASLVPAGLALSSLTTVSVGLVAHIVSKGCHSTGFSASVPWDEAQCLFFCGDWSSILWLVRLNRVPKR